MNERNKERMNDDKEEHLKQLKLWITNSVMNKK